MNRNQIRILTVTVLLLALLLAASYCAVVTRKPAEPAPAAQTLLLQGGGGGSRTPSAQCVNPNCAAATPNLECEYFGPGQGCQTWVMGGGGAGAFNRADAERVDDYDHAEFLSQRVMLNSKAMAAAGVEVGSTITHIDGQFIDNQKEFAAAVLDLRGKTLRIIRPDGSRAEITLK